MILERRLHRVKHREDTWSAGERQSAEGDRLETLGRGGTGDGHDTVRDPARGASVVAEVVGGAAWVGRIGSTLRGWRHTQKPAFFERCGEGVFGHGPARVAPMQHVLVWLLDLGSGSLETADSSVETATAHDGRRPHEGRPPAKGDPKPLQCTSGCTGKLGLTEDGAINVAALCPAQPAVLARCEVYATCLFGTPV